MERESTEKTAGLNNLKRFPFSFPLVWTAVFSFVFLLANLLGTKLLFSSLFPLVAGTLLYPITLIISDIVTELYGPKEAKKMLLFSLSLTLFIGCICWICGFSLLHPLAWIGSLTAFLVSQFLDISFYQFLKIKTQGRYLWFRAQASSFLSQGVDTFIASLPVLRWLHDLSWKKTFLIMGNHFIYKSFISIMLLPILTIIVIYARRSKV